MREIPFYLGLTMVAVGVGMISIPVGIIVAGVEMAATAAWLLGITAESSEEVGQDTGGPSN